MKIARWHAEIHAPLQQQFEFDQRARVLDRDCLPAVFHPIIRRCIHRRHIHGRRGIVMSV
jgi:hypothetical protein